MRRKTTYLSLLILLLAAHHGVTQQSKSSQREFKPLIFASKDDNLPEEINVRGTITEITFPSAYCGWVRNAGTLKIKLTEQIADYPHQFVYVAAACFLDLKGEEKYLGQEVCFTAKLMRDCRRCPEVVSNTIDSGGLPFYWLSWVTGGRKSFLEQIGCDVKK
jgi:hypothetical protein